ncbi:SDR family NAD(P)-dependent oxidoreductase [Effusibacillus dendaii]|uniref:Uncharacterized protein n=1 Tax=Effusibacillus dendaii TaxID=2743772 RepID=A0A7I8D561_9BACL|nr:SDR family NAD(P)-dependent oxidoreductase [Effusibacillus dendaii]BCJ85215.1 hypothetical protein skT53_02000 [Effusibacillus dendaii]
MGKNRPADRAQSADKVAIVTGGANGIGKEICIRLAEAGTCLLIADVQEQVQETAESVAAQFEVASDFYMGDLSREEHGLAMMERAIARFGKIDVLVNNAGGGVILPFLEHTSETLKTTIDRNLWTTIWACHAVLPHMVGQNFGRIINIGADSVRTGLYNHAAYNAAKGGVHALTTGLAREFVDSLVHQESIYLIIFQNSVIKKCRSVFLRKIDHFTNQIWI